VTVGVGLSAGLSAQLFGRIGTRPVIVAGTLIAAAGMYYLSRLPDNGSYVSDLLPGLLVMSIGLGAVFVSVNTAANAGVPADKAGLAAGLINTSQQLGSALGLAIFSAIATATTTDLLSAPGADGMHALTAGYRDALLACAIFLLAASAFALRTANSRGEIHVPVAKPLPDPVAP
jgi:MFS family permease